MVAGIILCRNSQRENLTGISMHICLAFPEELLRSHGSSVLPKLPELQLVLFCTWATLQGTKSSWGSTDKTRRALYFTKKSYTTATGLNTTALPLAEEEQWSAASPLLTFSVVQLLRYSGKTLPILPFSGNSWITSRPLVRAERKAKSRLLTTHG